MSYLHTCLLQSKTNFPCFLHGSVQNLMESIYWKNGCCQTIFFILQKSLAGMEITIICLHNISLQITDLQPLSKINFNKRIVFDGYDKNCFPPNNEKLILKCSIICHNIMQLMHL